MGSTVLGVSCFNQLGNYLRRVLVVSNAVPFTLRQVYDKIGGFDESLYAGEDMKFAKDLKNTGKEYGKRFCIIQDGYVLKSARKFERYGGFVIMFGLLMFLLNPWLVRSKKACFFWYSGKR